MYRFLVFVMFTLTGSACLAQLQPKQRVIQRVQNPSMVIDDRGSPLEVFPTERAIPGMSKSGERVVYRVLAKDASDPISPKQLGVVFNYAMQVQGYITGEIAFKFKDNLQPSSSFDAASYPGLAKLTRPNVYLVVARSPLEFIQLVKRLQGRTDLEWVEPIVLYGQSEGATPR